MLANVSNFAQLEVQWSLYVDFWINNGQQQLAWREKSLIYWTLKYKYSGYIALHNSFNSGFEHS